MSIFVYSLWKPFWIEFFGHIMPCRAIARAIAVVVISTVQEIGGKQNNRTSGNDHIHSLRFIDLCPTAMPAWISAVLDNLAHPVAAGHHPQTTHSPHLNLPDKSRN